MGLEWSTEDGVAVIRFERPQALNAIDVKLLQSLSRDLDTAVAEGATGVVIAGSDRMFCAGVDLGLVRSALASDPRAALDPVLDLLEPLILRLRSVPFPTVAALEGAAVGVGMSLALATDLRVAGRSASLVPGYLRIGASPDGGLSAFLPRYLGGARALSALVRNHRFASDEMKALGLVEEVTEDGSATGAAVRLLADVGATSPRALVASRALIDTGWSSSLEEQLVRERGSITSLWDTADYREGVGAFLEKRTPRFTGT